ncbi:hypothetical protein [Pinirhizobacter sp.]|jgi:hypothetical protein|uniref:hypothetical protein n=1 Tax=Pinirhizobacter sp. TaxID=2950432 RepID=UPI002F3E8897
MSDRIGRVVRAMGLVVGLGWIGGLQAADASPRPTEATWAAIVDHAQPLASRQQALAQIEANAGELGGMDLYMLGSIYHSGHHSGGLFANPDLARAAFYLGNAATRGSVPAMGKMAQVAFEQRNYREAMNWAQIYAHYVSDRGGHNQSERDFAAELIKRIQRRLGDDLEKVLPDVQVYIAVHDAQIKEGSIRDALFRSQQPKFDGARLVMPAESLSPQAAMADFILVFKPDGSVADVLPIDIAPDEQGMVSMSRALTDARTSATTTQGPRYALMNTVLLSGRYRAR